MQIKQSSVGIARRRLVAALACALALICVGVSTAAGATTAVKPPASASLEQCVTAVEQVNRSATFVGEMNAVPGTARMQMRIELLERAPSEASFHTVTSPGLGAWQRSSPGVKTYKNVNKVTDLGAPALYRAAIRFRWLNSRGHAIKVLDLRTPRCDEPTAPAPGAETGAAGAVAPAH
jgi:hypothetical protein